MTQIPGFPDGRIPARSRTPSGHDIPVPEAVFLALQSLGQKIDTGKADTDLKIAGLAEKVSAVAASSSDRWVNLLKVVIPAVLTIVGGTAGINRLTAPAPAQAPAARTLADTLADECRPLPAGTTERFECFQRVQDSQTYGRPR